MNSIHDLGGMDNIGPLNIEQDEPVFHADWERKTFALTLAVLATGACPVDEIRHMSELIPPRIICASSTMKNGCAAWNSCC